MGIPSGADTLPVNDERVPRIRNPWGTAPVTIQRNGKRAQALKGQLLMFDTEPGDVITLRGN